jgi:hypothetical protein
MPKPSKPSSHPLKDEGVPAAPVRQHHRMALNQKVSGETNPYGADRPPTDNKITNAKKNY